MEQENNKITLATDEIPVKVTLGSLLASNEVLEAKLEDAETYSQELETMWEDTQIEIKKKVDAYGFVIDEIKTRIEFLKAKKAKLGRIEKVLENEIDKIKTYLYHHCDGKVLKGNEYSISPQETVTRVIALDKVEPTAKRYTVDNMNFEQYSYLKEKYPDVKVKESAILAGLPECKDAEGNVIEHPAVIKTENKSVRIR